MDIRSDRQKGMSYVELGRKYHEVLDHIFSEEAKSKRKRAYEKQIHWIALSGFAA